MFDLKTKIALFGIFASLSFMWWAIIHKSINSVDPNIIYSQLSNDNWGTYTARDTIDEEYKVVLTKDKLTITELVPGSIFFKNFVKDSTVQTITFPLEYGGYKSNEYWATLVDGDKKLKIFDTKVSGAYIQATSSIVRVVLNIDGWALSDTYYFWPSKENKQ